MSLLARIREWRRSRRSSEPSPPLLAPAVEGGEWTQDWHRGKLRIRASFPGNAPAKVSIRRAGEVVRQGPAPLSEAGTCAFSSAACTSSLAHLPNPPALALEID